MVEVASPFAPKTLSSGKATGENEGELGGGGGGGLLVS